MMTTTGDDKAHGTVQIVRFVTASDAADDGASQKTDAIDVGDSGVLEDAAQVTAALRAANEKIVADVDDDNHIVTDSFVRVSWAAPGMPNLTPDDLPGFVNTTGDGESETLSADVEALLRRYMAQERTVMLCIVPANVDYHNSLALKLAGEFDKAGERTVAVVTKPDLCDAGAESDAIRLVNNEVKHLKLGWSCVKARSQQNLTSGVTLAASELAETRFFVNNEHWRALDKSLVGIGALRTKLSDILERQTERTLPDVLREIEQRKAAAAASLEALSVAWDTPSVRRSAFNAVTGRQVAMIDAGIGGKYTLETGFFEHKSRRYRAQMHAHEQVLRDAIYKRGQSDDDDSSDDDNDNDDDNDDGGSELQELIAKSRGDQLPGFLNYDLFKIVVTQNVGAFEAPMAAFLDGVEKMLKTLVNDAVAYVFFTDATHIGTVFKHVAAEAMKETLAALRVDAAKQLEIEKSTPYTMNHYYVDQLMKMKAQEEQQRLLEQVNHVIDRIEQVNISCNHFIQGLHLRTSADNLKAKIASRLTSQVGIGTMMNEEWEAKEMRMRLSAYITVAGKRFIDEVPMRVDHSHVRPLSNMLASKWSQLGDTDEKLTLLMTEGTTRQSKRQALQKELATLTAAQAASKAFILGN